MLYIGMSEFFFKYKKVGNCIIFCKTDVSEDIILTKVRQIRKTKVTISLLVEPMDLYNYMDIWIIHIYIPIHIWFETKGRLGNGGARGRKMVKKGRI